jgi:Raf kinase inhibitor-like YbhB/YbcL family protein
MMPAIYSADGQNFSPPLSWTGIPAEAKSLVLIVEDPDAPTPNPFLHWLVYNMPATTRELPAAIPAEPTLTMPVEMSQGRNSGLRIGYAGAAPPRGDTPHRYFFQLFALDRRLDLDGGAGRSAVVSAMQGHVIGKGCLIGTYRR